MSRTLRGGGEVPLAEASPIFHVSDQWFRDDASDCGGVAARGRAPGGWVWGLVGGGVGSRNRERGSGGILVARLSG